MTRNMGPTFNIEHQLFFITDAKVGLTFNTDDK